MPNPLANLRIQVPMRKRPATTGRPKVRSRQASEVGSVAPSKTGAQDGGGATASKTLAASGPRSLMKTSELGAGKGDSRRLVPQPASKPKSPSTRRRKPEPTGLLSNRQQKIEERIAAATEE